MTIEELQKIINEELKIDNNHLDQCSMDNPIHIQKYITFYFLESKKLNALQVELDELIKDKMIFYKTDFKYVPENQKELLMLVEGDKNIIEKKKELLNKSTITKFLLDTIANFRDRGWAIKNAIDFQKFRAGE